MSFSLNHVDRRQLVAQFWNDIVGEGGVGERFGASVEGGPRTARHNYDMGGSDESKHLYGRGWGCAADLWFDTYEDRLLAIEWLEARGYYCYAPPVRGNAPPTYHPQRLHVQLIGYGELPPGVSE